jgi:phage-related protein
VDKNQKHRKITFYKNYFQDFFSKQKNKVKAKIVWTFELIEDLQRVPETYLKHLENTDGLYEIRVQLGSDIFRIFCFFDKGQLVVLANGFQKKSQKTPKKEIEMALKIKAEYELEIAKSKK